MAQPRPLEDMLQLIQAALKQSQVRDRIREDWIAMLKHIGVAADNAEKVVPAMLTIYQVGNCPLETIEYIANAMLEGLWINTRGLEGKHFPTALASAFEERASKIHTLVAPHLTHTGGIVLDFGCGDAAISKLLQLQSEIDVLGADLTDQQDVGCRVPFHQLGGTPDGMGFSKDQFTGALVVDVLSYIEPESRVATLKALRKAVQGPVVFVEPVPLDGSFLETNIQLLNAYFMERVLKYGRNLPLPWATAPSDEFETLLRLNGWNVDDQELVGDNRLLSCGQLGLNRYNMFVATPTVG
ncbi:MAG: hypothetical protein RL094_391 [Candidatus Parcubacteria bacterium]|jgi:hypothetical protein